MTWCRENCTTDAGPGQDLIQASLGVFFVSIQNKKRRRGTKVRMPQKNISKFIKPVFTHPIVAEQWDNDKSALQNLSSMGLTLLPNKAAKVEATGKTPVEFIGESSLPFSWYRHTSFPALRRSHPHEEAVV